MVYKWRSGYSHKTDPEVAAGIMNELAEQGKLDAKTLVDVSRPEDAPLHQEFEWDNDVAAERWRQHQGRNLINALVMIPDDEEQNENINEVRVFFKVDSINREQYESTRVLIQTQGGKDALRDMARKELAQYRNKYLTILQWAGADTGINEAYEALEQVAQ